MSFLNMQRTSSLPRHLSSKEKKNSSKTGLLSRCITDERKCSNILPGRFNKACSTYFGGYYHGLYSGSSDEEFEGRYTNRKAMTFLRRSRGQKYLAERKVGEWPFPCEVIRVTSGSMVVRQWIPEGIEEDYAEPEHKDTEIEIFLDPEVMEAVYVYVSFWMV